MKFGGTSVGNSERILHVASITADYSNEDSIVVVVSAMAGVTDDLIALLNLSLKNKTLLQKSAAELVQKHVRTLHELGLAQAQFEVSLRELHHMLDTLAVWLNEYSGKPEEYDKVISFGERLSAFLLSKALVSMGVRSQMVLGTEVVATNSDFGNAKADIPRSKEMGCPMLTAITEKGIVPVVTGFFGKTPEGKLAILGRGGSDYTAAILAAVCEADELIVWKEVDGVFTADPHKDASAQFITEMTYDRAAKMARAGAKVLHPETMEPVRIHNIPVIVKNTFKPEGSGTRIFG